MKCHAAGREPLELDDCLRHSLAAEPIQRPEGAGPRSFRRKNHRLEVIFLLIAQFGFEVLQRNLN
jgi:hypothetical protein